MVQSCERWSKINERSRIIGMCYERVYVESEFLLGEKGEFHFRQIAYEMNKKYCFIMAIVLCGRIVYEKRE